MNSSKFLKTSREAKTRKKSRPIWFQHQTELVVFVALSFHQFPQDTLLRPSLTAQIVSIFLSSILAVLHSANESSVNCKGVIFGTSSESQPIVDHGFSCFL